MTIKLVYNWRNRLNKEGKAEIEICISQRHKRDYQHTGLFVEPDYWDKTKSEIRKNYPRAKELNQRIKRMVLDLQEKETQLILKGDPYTIDDLLRDDAKKQTFLDYCRSLAERSNVTEGRKVVYQAFFRYISELFGENFYFDKIDYSFVLTFDNFLRNKKRKITHNSIMMYHSVLKKFLGEAIKDDLMDPRKDPYRNGRFRIELEETERKAPSTEMVKILEDLDLSANYRFSVARDMFLFGCYTGLRLSDIKALTWNNVKVVDGKTYISIKEKKEKKTNQHNIGKLFKGKPLLILERYHGTDGPIFPDITRTELTNAIDFFNELWGTTSKESRITFHGSRHYCFTYLAQHGMDLRTLQEFSRHADIAMLSNYLHAQNQDDALDNVKWN